ncbi:protein-tyrosine phosphatase-like protein [Clohesyomyces aquaticus]|uniref:Protein-tyrosine phosphatase-like protein n=1 Tax=Clohesyomyces aquaticus TaxID=1231657 RepID=A0A1Y1ZMC0_9PLEO|nr:protein-tyrosine phosphatase-like protein [Clohesyomyces aquaticus]
MYNRVVKTGVLYRGARPDNASAQDRKRLVEEYGIRTIIDLRTDTEHVEQAQKRDAQIKSSVATVGSKQQAEEELKISGITYHDINFNGSAFRWMLIRQLTWMQFFRLVYLSLLGYRLDAIKVIAPIMNAQGLVGLAKNSLDVCTAEVKLVFDILADQNSYPVMVHCTQGKDRTGLVVMLALFLLRDVNVEAITKDYLLSESELQPEREGRVKEIESIGLTEHFVTCPKEMVTVVEKHLVDEHGSVEAYLEKVGVSKEQQEAVKDILTAKQEPISED